MNKIIGICLNTAIDQIVVVDSFVFGNVTRAKNSVDFPSGKSVNSARALAAEEVPFKLLGLVGAESISNFKTLQTLNISVDFTPVTGHTRRNITIVQTDGLLVSHLQTPGFSASPSELDDVEEKLLHTLNDGDVVIMSGSLPNGVDNGIYQTLIGRIRERAKVILDSSGEAFRKGVAAVPFAIKPNLVEFNALCNTSFQPTQVKAIARRVMKFLEAGISVVVVSIGPNGAVFGFGETKQVFWAKPLHIDRVQISNETGAGDAMVGGIAFALISGMPQRELMKYSVGLGTATLSSIGPGSVDAELLGKAVNHTVIESIVERSGDR